MLYFLSQQEIAQKVNSREVKIGFIGLGRVGLPLAATLASKGFEVLGIDVNENAVAKVNAARVSVTNSVSATNKSPFADEAGLPELLQEVTAQGKLRATTEIARVRECDVVIIAVPTLIRDSVSVAKKEPEIDAVRIVAGELAENLPQGRMIVLQSTVPLLTTQDVLGRIIEERTGLQAGRDFGLAYSPERTQAPQVLRDLKTYPKIVGGINEQSTCIISQIYATFSPGIIRMNSLVAAEMEKVIENTCRDVNIAFANELASVCEVYGVDVYEIIEAANSQPYSHILNPGLVGGHCIPMDPYYIISDACKRGVTPKLMQTARDINEAMFQHVVDMIDEGSKKITILGLSFKKDVKSFETSHTLKLVHLLKEKGYDVTVHDPFLANDRLTDVSQPTPDEQLPCKGEPDLYLALQGADCVILSTAHSEYGRIDFHKVKRLMRGNLIIDIRGMFPTEKVSQSGLRYKGPGRSQFPSPLMGEG